jgi:hypothetical protein
MKCPLCKKGKLALCQDAIIPQLIIKKKSGGYSIYPMIEKINYLDMTWLECDECHATSEENETLQSLYDKVTA